MAVELAHRPWSDGSASTPGSPPFCGWVMPSRYPLNPEVEVSPSPLDRACWKDGPYPGNSRRTPVPWLGMTRYRRRRRSVGPHRAESTTAVLEPRRTRRYPFRALSFAPAWLHPFGSLGRRSRPCRAGNWGRRYLPHPHSSRSTWRVLPLPPSRCRIAFSSDTPTMFVALTMCCDADARSLTSRRYTKRRSTHDEAVLKKWSVIRDVRRTRKPLTQSCCAYAMAWVLKRNDWCRALLGVP